MFKVQKNMCSTCIYRPDSPLDLEELESQVADKYGGFEAYRQCHHDQSKNNGACCRGFWNKDKFQLGQVAQRLDMVQEVEVDDLNG
jgi:hypothetical protein